MNLGWLNQRDRNHSDLQLPMSCATVTAETTTVASWPEANPMGENIEEHVKCDAGSLAPCSPDIPFKDISNAAARRMAYNALALHVAAHNCDYYIVKYRCMSLEQLQNLVTQYAIGIQRLEAQEQEALASSAERWTSKERARKVTIKLQSAAN